MVSGTAGVRSPDSSSTVHTVMPRGISLCAAVSRGAAAAPDEKRSPFSDVSMSYCAEARCAGKRKAMADIMQRNVMRSILIVFTGRLTLSSYFSRKNRRSIVRRCFSA